MGASEQRVEIKDRATILTSVLLLVIAAAAWVSVVRASLRGDDMMMTMPMPLTAADGLAFVIGWGVMMTAMMLPSALPMISLYGAAQRRTGGTPAPALPAGAARGRPPRAGAGGERPRRGCPWRGSPPSTFSCGRRAGSRSMSPT